MDESVTYFCTHLSCCRGAGNVNISVVSIYGTHAFLDALECVMFAGLSVHLIVYAWCGIISISAAGLHSIQDVSETHRAPSSISALTG